MNRRNFIKWTGLASGSLVLPGLLILDQPPSTFGMTEWFMLTASDLKGVWVSVLFKKDTQWPSHWWKDYMSVTVVQLASTPVSKWDELWEDTLQTMLVSIENSWPTGWGERLQPTEAEVRRASQNLIPLQDLDPQLRNQLSL